VKTYLERSMDDISLRMSETSEIAISRTCTILYIYTPVRVSFVLGFATPHVPPEWGPKQGLTSAGERRIERHPLPRGQPIPRFQQSGRLDRITTAYQISPRTM
jgi:hypothetical protein